MNEIGISILPHNDIHLDLSGNLVMVHDNHAIGQHVRQRLKTWYKEWFLNTDVGVDWLRFGLGADPRSLPILEATTKKEILTTKGVAELLEYNSSFDAKNRGLTVTSCQVRTINDEIIDIRLE